VGDLVNGGLANGHVRDRRNAKDAHALVARHHHFGNRGHANGVCASALQESDLGHALVRWSPNHGINAFAQRETVLLRHTLRDRAQLGVVRAEHVQETHAELGLVRTHQRTLAGHAHDVEVVGDHHQVARGKAFVETARGVGDDQHVGAESPQHAHGKGDVAQAVALIEVHPAAHRGHGNALQLAHDELAGMARNRGNGKMRDIGERHHDWRVDLVGQVAQP
jgi:hypothetical protein